MRPSNILTQLWQSVQSQATLAAWLSGNDILHSNEVHLHRAQLVLGWATVGELKSHASAISVFNQMNHPGNGNGKHKFL